MGFAKLRPLTPAPSIGWIILVFRFVPSGVSPLNCTYVSDATASSLALHVKLDEHGIVGDSHGTMHSQETRLEVTSVKTEPAARLGMDAPAAQVRSRQRHRECHCPQSKSS